MQNPQTDRLLHFLRIKSISTQDEYLSDMEQARHFLVDLFSDLGFQTKALEGKRHDAIFTQRITDPKLPTVLIYGHYDVQPPDPLDQWKTDPFEPKILNGKIYARGATDNKGQLMVHIMAVKSLIEKHGLALPVNFKFFIEGEEEIGSISIASIVAKHKKDLACDYILVSDSEMPKPKHPAIDISLRGLVYTEVIIRAAQQDLHSGQFGGVAENPANVLAYIIAALKDKSGRITIPKFYDQVLPPTKKELQDYKALTISKKELSQEGKMFGVGGGEEWYSVNERRWARPTLDVNGIISGYTGQGSKTIIPAQASAKISMRLVPNQDPYKIYADFVKYVKKLAPRTTRVEVVKHADALPYKAPTDSHVFDLIKKSLRKAFGQPAVFSGVGGSIGFVPIVAKALKVPCLMVGFGLPDENLHSPNEHFLLDNYGRGIKAMVDFYQKLPTLKTAKNSSLL